MSTRRALAFSFLDRYAGLAVAFGSSMVLARLLTPQELGVYSVTMVLLTFVSALRDLGAGQYLLQEKELTRDRIRATWAVMLAVGAIFCILISVTARPLASLYEDTRIESIMRVVALNFAVSPFGSLTYAWLMREMRFDTLAAMRFISGVAGATLSIYFVWTGHGPIGLAYGNLAATLVNAAIASWVRPRHFPWLPGLREWRRVLSFGSRISGTSVVNTLSSGAPELIVGKLHGLAAAGYFTRATGLTAMFHRLVMDAVASVSVSLFAQEHRRGGDVSGVFVKAVTYVTVLGWSFFIGLALMATPVLRLLYGHQWDAAAELIQVLSLSFIMMLPSALCSNALTAVGAARCVLRNACYSGFIMVTAALAGAVHSPLAMCIGMVAAQAASCLLWLISTQRIISFDTGRMLTSLACSMKVALLSSVGPWVSVIIYGFHPAESFVPILVAMALGSISFASGLFIFQHPLLDEVKRFLRYNLKSTHQI